MYPNEKF